MKNIIDIIEDEIKGAFDALGYDSKFAKVTLSNRPDLCEFQCNGAMPLAKILKTAPINIADSIAQKMSSSKILSQCEAVMPGFLNLKVDSAYLASYVAKMLDDETLGYVKSDNPQKIIIDYGGPNVAKPLHVGHLRSAIIGESIKRICRFDGHEVIGDVHLGDWGLQMGLIITELKERQPDLVYFDDGYQGDYPKEPPFTISELEEIYPTASLKSKEDEEYKKNAMEATALLQAGKRGYRALLKHILDVSVSDLKRNYEKLDVSFDLWKGESDAQPYIPDMVDKMKKDGYAYISDGALVVDVGLDTDKKEIPPCMILKSDGASLYNTTDLATLIWRMKDYSPDRVIYVVDKRQELYFTQVFRCAKKTKIVPENVRLDFLGFGTMNGNDKKPFKTREGGVMRLESLLDETNEEMKKKITQGGKVDEGDIKETTGIIALAALKYGDLSNQASKDYIFDIDRFTSFEGNTGPYILYSIVRIKSILRKYTFGEALGADIMPPQSECEKSLMLKATGFSTAIKGAYEELAPHRICAYVYEVCEAFNHFYHETPILSEKDEKKQKSYIALLKLIKEILVTSIDLLGFSSPEYM